MMITIDPAELVAASETLRSCATESADIGTQLWSCAQCAMPADIRGVVDQLVATADRVLDEIAAQLSVRSTDLANRAQIAVNDSLVAASEANSLTGLLPSTMTSALASGVTITVPGGSPAESIFGGTMTIGGSNPNVFTITGSPFDTLTIGGDGFSGLTGDWTNAIIGGSYVGGGRSDFGGLTDGWTTVSIGAPDYSQGPLSGVFALAEASDRINTRHLAVIDAILANPNSTPYEFRVAAGLQDSISYGVSHILAPSRQDLDDQYGYHLTDSEVASLSPYTLPRPYTPLLFP